MVPQSGTRGMIAVDKIGCKILFINPQTYATEKVLDGFQRTVHELCVVPDKMLAYVPIFGDGIHGRNPNPGRHLYAIDLAKREVAAKIDLSPFVGPHTVREGRDQLIYITCENSAVVAIIDPKTQTMIGSIETGSTNGHRLCIADDGQRIYTDNEEDATISVIDLPARKLLGKIATPQALAGIAVSPDGGTVVAVSDIDPVVFLIDTKAEKVTRTITLEGVAKAAQIARYSPDGKLVVTSLNSNKVSIIDTSFGAQTAVEVGSQPMDMAFRGNELFVSCQGDGSIHVIDIAGRKHKTSFAAGTGCESVGFW